MVSCLDSFTPKVSVCLFVVAVSDGGYIYDVYLMIWKCIRNTLCQNVTTTIQVLGNLTSTLVSNPRRHFKIIFRSPSSNKKPSKKQEKSKSKPTKSLILKRPKSYDKKPLLLKHFSPKKRNKLKCRGKCMLFSSYISLVLLHSIVLTIH